MTYMGTHCHGNNADPFKYAMLIHVTQTLMAACCCIQLDGTTRRIIAFSSLMARAFVERQNILQHDTLLRYMRVYCYFIVFEMEEKNYQRMGYETCKGGASLLPPQLCKRDPEASP